MDCIFYKSEKILSEYSVMLYECIINKITENMLTLNELQMILLSINCILSKFLKSPKPCKLPVQNLKKSYNQSNTFFKTSMKTE